MKVAWWRVQEIVIGFAILAVAEAWVAHLVSSSSNYSPARFHPPRNSRLLSAMAANPTLMPYPRGAVSVAVRCEYEGEAYYLLVQRGKEPNQGRWSFPGGKLELGETALQGGKRELGEETKFLDPQEELLWCPDTIATQDSILVSNDGTTQYHFLIAICFAQFPTVIVQSLPKVLPADDAADAKWWNVVDLVGVDVTPGLVERIQRTEFLYQKGALQ